MFIFLYGPDTYRSRQKLNEIIERYKKTSKSGLNLNYFDFKKDSYQGFKDEFQTISMFQENKLAVLENAFSNADFKRKFLKDSKKFADLNNIILFYEGNEVPKNDSLFKFLEKNAKFQQFEFLTGQKLKSLVKKEFEKYHCHISDIALEKLIEFTGNDLWQIANEIQKLIAYRAKQKIEKEDVELLVGPKIEADIFKTIDAISSGDKKQALILIHKHLEKGDSPLYLLSMINFQFRNLLEVKDLVERNTPYYLIPKISNLHPFIIKKSYQQIGRFTLGQLKKIYQKIFEVDFKIKTGKLEPEAALDILIAEI